VMTTQLSSPASRPLTCKKFLSHLSYRATI